MDSTSNLEAYAQPLLRKDHGFPMLVPEAHTNLPPEYRKRGIDHGDLIHLNKDGTWDLVGNPFYAKDSPINQGRVPGDFHSISKAEADVCPYPSFHKAGTQISTFISTKLSLSADCSASTPGVPTEFGAGFSFTSKTSAGAALVIPHGADRCDYTNYSQLRDWIQTSACSLFEHVNGPRGKDAQHLYFITGSDKTTEWGLAAYTNRSRDVNFELSFTAAVAGGGTKYSWTGSSMESVMSRVSNDSNIVDLDTPNQAVFVRGFMISQRPRSFHKGMRCKIRDIEKARPWSKGGSSILNSIQTRLLSARVRSSSSSSPISSTPAPASTSSASSSTQSSPSNSPFSTPYQSPNSSMESLSHAFYDSDYDTDSEDEDEDQENLFHPLHKINALMFEHVEDDVEYIVSHDNDWMSLDIDVSDDGQLLQSVLSSFTIHREGNMCFLIPSVNAVKQDTSVGVQSDKSFNPTNPNPDTQILSLGLPPLTSSYSVADPLYDTIPMAHMFPGDFRVPPVLHHRHFKFRHA